MLRHSETDELLATMLVNVDRQDGVNLEMMDQYGVDVVSTVRGLQCGNIVEQIHGGGDLSRRSGSTSQG